MEGSRHGIFKVLCHHLPGRTEENHENPVRIAEI
jgi:hypothetical protein